MDIKEKNQIVYKCANEYLKSILPENLTEQDLEKYFIGDKSDFTKLKDVFIQLIRSAQNYQRMPNTIKFKERFNDIKIILYDFDYNKVAMLDAVDLYYNFRNKFNVISKDTKMNSWYKWSRSIIDAANFVCSFKDVEDFKHFISLYDYNTVTRMLLPLLISSKISGIGFPLACDFLKELGYLNYPKPDVHIVDIFSELGLSDRNIMNVFEAVIRMYEDCIEIDSTVSPYKIDKILWLICSGKFYLDGLTVTRHKEIFIKNMKELLIID